MFKPEAYTLQDNTTIDGKIIIAGELVVKSQYLCSRLVPAQDVHFFYTRSHLSALQKCALLFSTNFQFNFIFKECTTKFSH